MISSIRLYANCENSVFIFIIGLTCIRLHRLCKPHFTITILTIYFTTLRADLFDLVFWWF